MLGTFSLKDVEVRRGVVCVGYSGHGSRVLVIDGSVRYAASSPRSRTAISRARYWSIKSAVFVRASSLRTAVVVGASN
jgi:hypothetical protein